MLGAWFTGLVAVLVEGLVLWAEDGSARLFLDVWLVTAASFAFAQAGDNVRHYGAQPARLRLQRVAYGLVVLGILTFAATVFFVAKRDGQELARWYEYVVLGGSALSSWGFRFYVWWVLDR